ncbi:MAG TPA: hypothetical protein VFM05_10115, partial [Candidatus Saccharimonadales bacterium]|nr:hypothetical protein [Candidatus Saccharimonadales bacterium]
GDNKAADLISQQFAGTFDINHIYDNAGIYKVVIKATDKNGQVAFLQLVAVANGAISATDEEAGDTKIITRILWIPALLALPLIFLSFWLGRRYELAELRKHLEQHENLEG